MNPTGTLRISSIFSLIAIFLATAFIAGARPAEALTNCTVSAADLTFDSEEQSFLRLLNDYRAQNGAGPLTASVNLNRAAAWMANDLVNRPDQPQHTDTLGRDPFVRMAQCDASPPGAGLAENIAGGPSYTGADILAQWKTSPSHDFTMKRADLKQIGIARDFNANNQYPWQWVTDFQTVDDGTNMLPPPPVSQPITSLESPANGNIASSFWISGWAIDKAAPQNDGVDLVHAYVYPADASGNQTGPQVFFSGTNFPQPRSDVANAYGGQFISSGFSVMTPTLQPGTYRVVVYAHSTMSNSWNPTVRIVTVTGPVSSPLMDLNYPPAGVVPGVFDLNGWAIDRGATSGTGVDLVHIYVYPANSAGSITGSQVFFTGATYGGSRPDVANAYGQQFLQSAYTAHVTQLQAGYYVIRVYAHSTVGNTWSYLDRAVQVVGPLLAIESPPSSAQNPVGVGGWAIDRSAVGNDGVDHVHIYVYPANASGTTTGAYVFFAQAEVNGDRPDVAAVYGSQFRFSGYIQAVPTLANGYYNITVYLHSTVSNSWFSVNRFIGIGVPVGGASQADTARPQEPKPVEGSGSTTPALTPKQAPASAPPEPPASPAQIVSPPDLGPTPTPNSGKGLFR